MTPTLVPGGLFFFSFFFPLFFFLSCSLLLLFSFLLLLLLIWLEIDNSLFLAAQLLLTGEKRVAGSRCLSCIRQSPLDAVHIKSRLHVEWDTARKRSPGASYRASEFDASTYHACYGSSSG